MSLPPLAFVDVETNGLSPRDHRIAEIGVVAVDGACVERWSSMVRGGSAQRLGGEEWRAAPVFRDLAPALSQRLRGRLLVAHNARFDYAFLRAEFERAGVPFESEVACSVMLSRKLFPHLARHDLDSLAASFGLRVEIRHRALPDADLLWQWWQAMLARCSGEVVAKAMRELLAGPVLPAQLDPSLVDRLPSSPGAYMFRDGAGGVLATGAAHDLRAHVVDYFRLDRASARALEYAHRIGDIDWRATRGMLGARLHAAALARIHARRRLEPSTSWRFAPEAVPCVATIALEDCRVPDVAESYGLFASERRARNALARLAARARLCHALLALPEAQPCAACEAGVPGAGCGGLAPRKKQLLRAFEAIRPLRVLAWPYRGAIAIRERTDLHVVDRWQFLGTARDERDVHDLLAARRSGFDRRTYQLLVRELPRVPRDEIVDLSQVG